MKLNGCQPILGAHIFLKRSTFNFQLSTFNTRLNQRRQPLWHFGPLACRRRPDRVLPTDILS